MGMWDEVYELEKEDDSLEELTIKGQTFHFPRWPRAEFSVAILQALHESEGKIPMEQAMGMILQLIPAEDRERFNQVADARQQIIVTEKLMDHYLEQLGFTATKQGEGLPPLATDQSSQTKSSSDSEPSPPTSSDTTVNA